MNQKLLTKGLHDHTGKMSAARRAVPCPSDHLLTGREAWQVLADTVKRTLLKLYSLSHSLPPTEVLRDREAA